jgi:guanylate kinase
VSYTTRAPREGEVHGVNYNYISQDEFQAMIKAGDFIEYF